ncbi:TPA: DDE-type integrase/transposase/recombinase [Staphylococcus aureus]|uniref:DDE domain-containing protein n=2 Tax=Staphylococcus TaxID=1279 RepID=D2JAY2_STAAU|nr:hypothetical protein SAP045A_021 [Staphylococcus epidermidis]ADA62080.1 hypothetical protein SAP079A_010 [Staphylococcus aureus]AYX82842.1 DDE domain-containing protein [Staphylococcus haemolyticus]NMK72073.1 DDE-type integrase/transposase/recombinase [Staphylococcus capitis]AVA10134.1 DDE domain-containing protein [Staphylococcus epidermidis]
MKKPKKAYCKRRINETYIKIKGKWCYLYQSHDTDCHTLGLIFKKSLWEI